MDSRDGEENPKSLTVKALVSWALPDLPMEVPGSLNKVLSASGALGLSFPLPTRLFPPDPSLANSSSRRLPERPSLTSAVTLLLHFVTWPYFFS